MSVKDLMKMTPCVSLMICLILLGSQVHLSSQYTPADASSLIASLMTGYSSDVRPSQGTTVELGLGMMSIGSLDIVAEELSIAGYLLVSWTDSRLSWTPASYGNLQDISIKSTSIWTPPLVLNNAAGDIDFLNDNTGHTSNPTKIFYDGTVQWLLPINFSPSCSANVKYYPYDVQACDITVTSWMLISIEMLVFTSESDIEIDLFSENGEWDLLQTTAANESVVMAGLPTTGVTFNVKAKRRSTYYVVNLILPFVFLSFLGPFVFLLPVECGEKNGFALTIMLSLSVFITVVSDLIPKTATHFCILSLYILTVFLICTLETVLTVCSITIHTRHSKGYQLRGAYQNLARRLAKLTLYRRPDEGGKEKEGTPVVKTPLPDHPDEAWKDKDSGSTVDYTHEDLTTILDRLNFVLFSILTLLATIVFMLIISLGSD